AQAVNSAMEALPEELRQAVTLREIEGLSYEEIAEVMNCPIGTVRSRIFRAREAISAKVKPMLENQSGKRWERRLNGRGYGMGKMQKHEVLSALADGQLRGEAFARGVEAAACDPAALEAWHTYHLIGDVLRSGELAAGHMATAFLSGLQLRLQQEERLAGVGQPPARKEPVPRQEAA